ncbi:MAG: hypothetical protein U0T81_04695 [Saprospiraceae bacterium]
MQQHFNENYMESSKFPKARFKGKIIDMSKVSFYKPGTPIKWKLRESSICMVSLNGNRSCCINRSG